MLNDFLDDVERQVKETWNLKDAARFITEHTYHRGAKYSYKDHEFQEIIASDDSQVVNTQKCSQIGLSELTARWGVAVTAMIPDFSTITTFPFSGDASDFAKTRIDPFLESSPKLQELLNPKLNNSEMKQLGTGFMYFRGTNGKTQAISIPADCVISDEIDRSDPHVLSQYQSRLTHSNWQLRRNFSTPTVPGFGIAKEMETSKRLKNLCKCNHCARHFLPNYFEHVKIPDYDGDLRAITKHLLPKTRYLEAKLLCPHCGQEPDLGPQYREYVCENNEENHEARGYFVSPFDAPAIITVPFLIKASTSYARYSEFVNQNLGLAEEDSSESLTLADINQAFQLAGVDLFSTTMHAMGIDMGLVCHITVGRITIEGHFLIVHRERCPLSQLERRKLELQIKFRVGITVMDSLPYTDLVMRMQKTDKNCFGAVYSNSKALETFKVKMFEGEEAEGKLPIHTCQINRDKCFDTLLGAFKADEVLIQSQSPDEDELYAKHMLDMRRVQIFDTNQELTWSWIKTKDAQDHYHHSTLYCHVAAQLRGTIARSMPLSGIPLIRKTTIRSKQSAS